MRPLLARLRFASYHLSDHNDEFMLTSWIVGYLVATAIGALLIFLLGRNAPFDDDAP